MQDLNPRPYRPHSCSIRITLVGTGTDSSNMSRGRTVWCREIGSQSSKKNDAWTKKIQIIETCFRSVRIWLRTCRHQDIHLATSRAKKARLAIALLSRAQQYGIVQVVGDDLTDCTCYSMPPSECQHEINYYRVHLFVGYLMSLEPYAILVMDTMPCTWSAELARAVHRILLAAREDEILTPSSFRHFCTSLKYNSHGRERAEAHDGEGKIREVPKCNFCPGRVWPWALIDFVLVEY